MSYRRTVHRFWFWLLCGMGAACAAAPSTWTDPIRVTLRDLLVPGLTGVNAVQQFVQARAEAISTRLERLNVSAPANTEQQYEIDRLAKEVEQWQAQARRAELLQLEWKRKARELETYGPPPGILNVGEPLLQLELLECRVLGRASTDLWREHKLIDKGIQDGLVESVLVLDDQRPLIDQGADGDLRIGLPIFAGRCVVGRISKVGNWTSSVQSITDVNFRGGLAQICRQTDDGPTWGAVGKIEGMGNGQNLCRMTSIPATEAVSVGDHVYTAVEDGVLPGGLYYGEVVLAELKPGTLHWEIHVKPAVDLSTLQRVHVMLRAENPARRLGN